MKYLKTPGPVMTSNMQDHKSRGTSGDDYAGSTGYHLHHLYFHGHQSIDYMQDNRNTKGVTQAEVDAKCVPASSSSSEEKGFRLNRASTQSYPGNYYFDGNWDIKSGHTAKDR